MVMRQFNSLSLLFVGMLALVLSSMARYAPVEEEACPPCPYFIIQIMACGQPYPGVPVDVHTPDDDYLFDYSDENGQVFVYGDAGYYEIFASDGWSYQSTSYTWDGGCNRVRYVHLDC